MKSQVLQHLVAFLRRSVLIIGIPGIGLPSVILASHFLDDNNGEAFDPNQSILSHIVSSNYLLKSYLLIFFLLLVVQTLYVIYLTKKKEPGTPPTKTTIIGFVLVAMIMALYATKVELTLILQIHEIRNHLGITIAYHKTSNR